MRITFGALIPLPIDDAFDFVSNPANWPTFFASCTAAEALEGWGREGGRARMKSTVLGRELTSEVVLLEWDRPRRFRYVMHTTGRADTDNVRVFVAVPGGTQFTGTTMARARRGLNGVVDALTMLGLRRILVRGMRALPGRARAAVTGS